MEKLFKRFTAINQLILNNVDTKTLVNIKEASKEINKILNKEKFYWVRIINKHSA